jgi:hypothetical protein
VKRKQALKAIMDVHAAHEGKGMPDRTARAALMEAHTAVENLDIFPCGDVPVPETETADAEPATGEVATPGDTAGDAPPEGGDETEDSGGSPEDTQEMKPEE